MIHGSSYVVDWVISPFRFLYNWLTSPFRVLSAHF